MPSSTIPRPSAPAAASAERFAKENRGARRASFSRPTRRSNANPCRAEQGIVADGHEAGPRGFAAAAAVKVDELLARKSFDAIADLAEAYPMSVFPDAMGLKQEGRENLLPYAGLVFNAFGPPTSCARTPSSARRRIRPMSPNNASATTSRLAASAPASTPASTRRHHRGRGAAAGALAAVGGIDTTVNGIGAAIYCLARFPDQWRGCAPIRRWRATRSRRPSGSRARCRRSSGPRRARSRSAGTIGEGEKVLMFLGSANRDPRRWDNADGYDIPAVPRAMSASVPAFNVRRPAGRAPRRRDDAGGLARRSRSIEITGPVRRRYNNTLRGLESLPVAITPA